MTTVRIADADRRRAVSPDLFDDLLPGVVPTFTTAGEMLEVTFDCELDADAVNAVQDRLLSVDAQREAARAVLRADRDALAVDDPLRRLYDYVLGDAGL